MARVRLQKALAQAGLASRRKAEEMILAGRVRVNGVIVRELGVQVDARRDRIELDGRRVVAEKPVYYLVHKPRGMVTTMSDPEGRPTVRDLLKKIPERVFPVGRLDYHTSGVLLVTNDGEMAEALSSPRARVKKLYIAKFTGHLEDEELELLRKGVTLDDGYVTRPADVFVERVERDVTWLRIGISEGKNRQIHRMAEAIGKKVFRLARLEFAGLTAEGLRPGELRPLHTKELDALKKSYFNPHRRAKANALAERRRMLAEGGEIGFDDYLDADFADFDDGPDEGFEPERAAPARGPGRGRAADARGRGRGDGPKRAGGGGPRDERARSRGRARGGEGGAPEGEASGRGGRRDRARGGAGRAGSAGAAERGRGRSEEEKTGPREKKRRGKPPRP